MRPLSLAQFPGIRFVSQNEPTDDGPIWSAFWAGRFAVAFSERALFAALLEMEPVQ